MKRAGINSRNAGEIGFTVHFYTIDESTNRRIKDWRFFADDFKFNVKTVDAKELNDLSAF